MLAEKVEGKKNKWWTHVEESELGEIRSDLEREPPVRRDLGERTRLGDLLSNLLERTGRVERRRLTFLAYFVSNSGSGLERGYLRRTSYCIRRPTTSSVPLVKSSLPTCAVSRFQPCGRCLLTFSRRRRWLVKMLLGPIESCVLFFPFSFCPLLTRLRRSYDSGHHALFDLLSVRSTKNSSIALCLHQKLGALIKKSLASSFCTHLLTARAAETTAE